jgi:hypothetical protein
MLEKRIVINIEKLFDNLVIVGDNVNADEIGQKVTEALERVLKAAQTSTSEVTKDSVVGTQG